MSFTNDIKNQFICYAVADRVWYRAIKVKEIVSTHSKPIGQFQDINIGYIQQGEGDTEWVRVFKMRDDSAARAWLNEKDASRVSYIMLTGKLFKAEDERELIVGDSIQLVTAFHPRCPPPMPKGL